MTVEAKRAGFSNDRKWPCFSCIIEAANFKSYVHPFGHENRREACGVGSARRQNYANSACKHSGHVQENYNFYKRLNMAHVLLEVFRELLVLRLSSAIPQKHANRGAAYRQTAPRQQMLNNCDVRISFGGSN
jgi:hypothetical protein